MAKHNSTQQDLAMHLESLVQEVMGRLHKDLKEKIRHATAVKSKEAIAELAQTGNVVGQLLEELDMELSEAAISAQRINTFTTDELPTNMRQEIRRTVAARTTRMVKLISRQRYLMIWMNLAFELWECIVCALVGKLFDLSMFWKHV